ncbi:MAG: patatin-like phospholipase family protein [Marinilabiliales bacterium]|nr:patatin-like phospholipase family protein [Marinilabiliales bacterium]
MPYTHILHAKTITILAHLPDEYLIGNVQDTLLKHRIACQGHKLGLALSGGGAKGLAHIGVLKVMEEAGLRPDYITGVSMGSIVGGLVCNGILNLTALPPCSGDSDMNADLSDRIPENKIIFLEKNHFCNSIIVSAYYT